MIKARLKKRLDQCFIEGVERGLWTGVAEGPYVHVSEKQSFADLHRMNHRHSGM